jgi:hypothetical protein
VKPVKLSRIRSFQYFARGMCLIAQTDRIAYGSHAETEAGARQLMRPGETYTVEDFSDTGCPRCREG